MQPGHSAQGSTGSTGHTLTGVVGTRALGAAAAWRAGDLSDGSGATGSPPVFAPASSAYLKARSRRRCPGGGARAASPRRASASGCSAGRRSSPRWPRRDVVLDAEEAGLDLPELAGVQRRDEVRGEEDEEEEDEEEEDEESDRSMGGRMRNKPIVI